MFYHIENIKWFGRMWHREMSTTFHEKKKKHISANEAIVLGERRPKKMRETQTNKQTFDWPITVNSHLMIISSLFII